MLTYHRTTRNPTRNIKETITVLPTPKIISFPFMKIYENENLIGFINLYEEDTEIFFGIGVNPEFCNKGYGQQMTLL